MIKPMAGNLAGASPGAGGAVFSGGGGKNAVQQHFGSPHSGQKSTITAGDPMSRSMGHYGKGHSFAAPSLDPSMAMGPTKPPSIADIRGGSGTMKKNAREGGLGPGRMSTPGTAADYSMTSPDTE